MQHDYHMLNKKLCLYTGLCFKIASQSYLSQLGFIFFFFLMVDVLGCPNPPSNPVKDRLYVFAKYIFLKNINSVFTELCKNPSIPARVVLFH